MRTILLTMLLSSNAASAAPLPFQAAFVGLVIPIDTKDVGNSSNYRVLLNLVRPLISYGSHAQFVGDALERWAMDDAHKTYDLTLAENLKFSNGDPVTAEDAVRTLERMMHVGKAIHYDFTNFASVAVTGPRKFRIVLKSPDRNLLEAMTAPEFAPLHRSDYEASVPGFKVTSGAYFVKEAKPKELRLEKSPAFVASPGPSVVVVRSLTRDELLKSDPKLYDFIPAPQLEHETHDAFVKAGLKGSRVNIAYTHFVSLNAESALLSDLADRRYIQQLLTTSDKEFGDYTPAVTSTRQLYLADGPGRVSTSFLDRLGKKIAEAKRPGKLKPGTRLRLLSGVNSLTKRLVADKLRDAGFDLSVTTFKDWKQYTTLIKEQTFDLVEASNDFSAMELLENLRVTFNPGRPLIFLPKTNKIPAIVEKAKTEEAPSVRYALFEEIERTVLEDALIAPLYHLHRFVYLRDSYSLEAWNKSVPEIAFWKLQKL